jgi:HEAT repeat protein
MSRRTVLCLALLALGGCSRDGAPVESVAVRLHDPTPRGLRERAPAPNPVSSILEAWFAAEAAGDEAAHQRVAATLAAGGRPLLEQLVEHALVTEGPGEFHAASQLLRTCGEPVVPLLADAMDRDPATQQRALHLAVALGGVCRDPAVGDVLWQALVPHLGTLTDEAWSVAYDGLAPSAVSVVDELLLLWRGDDAQASRRAGWILSSVGATAPRIAGPALDALRAEASRQPEPPQTGDDDEDDTTAQASRERARIGFHILRAVGSTDPSILPDLTSLLRSPDAGIRYLAVEILATWGKLAADAGPELIRLLKDEDSSVRRAARETVPRIPAVATEHWRALISAFSSEEAGIASLEPLMSVPAFRDRVTAGADTLADAEREVVVWLLCQSSGADGTPEALERLLLDRSPAARRCALDRAEHAEGPLPASALRLVEDPDPYVRARALRLAASRGALPGVRVAAIARTLLANENIHVKRAAVDALGTMSDVNQDALDLLLDALTGVDASLRHEAAAGLARVSGPIPGDHAEAVAELEKQFAAGEGSSDQQVGGSLLRFSGGVAAVLRSAEVRLRRMAETGDAAVQGFFCVLRDLGPAAEPLRPLLETLQWKNGYQRRGADEVLAGLSTDPGRIARLGDVEQTVVQRLVAAGPPGLAALPLLAARADAQRREELIRWVSGLDLAATVIAAAQVGSSHDPAEATVRDRRESSTDALELRDGESSRVRMGAAVLARAVPPEVAVPVLERLVHDDSDEVTAAAAESLLALENARPGSVPVEALRRMLEDDAVEPALLELAAALGTRGAPLATGLEARCDSGDAEIRLRAAAALHAVSGRDDRLRAALLDALRSALDHGAWEVVRDLLPRIEWREADRDALVRILVRTVEHDRRVALLPVIEKLGPDAGPFVPGLCLLLDDVESQEWHGETTYPREPAQSVLRTLAAIGPAARPALPRIRRWIALAGDRDRVGTESVRAIEGR